MKLHVPRLYNSCLPYNFTFQTRKTDYHYSQRLQTLVIHVYNTCLQRKFPTCQPICTKNSHVSVKSRQKKYGSETVFPRSVLNQNYTIRVSVFQQESRNRRFKWLRRVLNILWLAVWDSEPVQWTWGSIEVRNRENIEFWEKNFSNNLFQIANLSKIIDI